MQLIITYNTQVKIVGMTHFRMAFIVLITKKPLIKILSNNILKEKKIPLEP